MYSRAGLSAIGSARDVASAKSAEAQRAQARMAQLRAEEHALKAELAEDVRARVALLAGLARLSHKGI